MAKDNQDIKNKIIDEALKNAAFDGWTKDMLALSAQSAGYEADMAKAVFPHGIADALNYLSHRIDEKMLEELKNVDTSEIRTRDRIELAVQIRLNIMTPDKEAFRRGASHWSTSCSANRASSAVWTTADAIWLWAGDTATDYNRYTKRTLLSAVILSTMLYWFQDHSPEGNKTQQFLKGRISNVMQFGKLIGKIKTFGRKTAA